MTRHPRLFLTCLAVGIFILCAIALMPFQAHAQCGPNPNATCAAKRLIVNTRSAAGAHEYSLLLPVDGGPPTIAVDGGDALRVWLPVNCSLAFGATDAGVCDDVACTVTGAANNTPCIVSGPNSQTTDTTLSCYVSGADTVKVRRCCQRHTGNSGADCAAVSSATYQVRVFP